MRRPRSLRALLPPVLAACLVVAGCGDDDENELADVAGEEAADVDAPEITQPDDLDDIEDEEPVAVDAEDVLGADVLEDPGAFVGQEVTVRAPVDRTIGAQAIELGGEAPAEPFLALSPEDFEVEDGELIELTGVVREVTPDTFEDDFGYPFDATFEDFEGRFALDVEEIQLAD